MTSSLPNMCSNDEEAAGTAYTAGYATFPQLSESSNPKIPLN